VSAYAFIPRSYDIKQLRDLRLVRALFPDPEPLPALAFPKPGQTIRLVPSLQPLPAPAFPKPSQFSRWTPGPETPVVVQQDVAEVTPYRIEADTPAARYLNALSELAHAEISYAAVREEFDTVSRCFGVTPDHELFALGYEKYLADSTTLTEDLQRVFRHYSWWLNLKHGAQEGGAQ
jgi:hypothetical protein